MILWWIGGIIVGYLSIGYLFHLVLFPETKPNPQNYLKTGDLLKTETGGNEIKMLGWENDDVILQLTFDPGAEGPPVHIQTEWDEYYKVLEGQLSLWYDGETKKLSEGEEITIPRGIPHKPFNPTDDPVVSKGKMPAQFVMYLDQIYKYMDEDERNAEPPRMIFQMAVSNQYFDSYLGEGPPVWVQKFLNFLLIPLARLMGYQSFYEKYRIR